MVKAARAAYRPRDEAISSAKSNWYVIPMDTCIKVLEKSDGTRRIVICLRDDGLYTYRLQFADTSGAAALNEKWGPMGPECGLYDSSDTAETEAMQRVEWLKARFH